MLLALTGGFALSQAFRTLAAILAPPLAREFALSAQALGLFAGAFHFAFGGLQLFMGIGIDLHGVRRTVLAVFPLTILGSVLCAVATRFEMLIAGQVLIGIGCAPAFLACTVFIARAYPLGRFAAMSGLTMGLGSVGMLVTGTPLAWVVEQFSWRAAFAMLGGIAAVAWGAIFLLLREPPAEHAPAPSIPAALRGYAEIFRLPHTAGILALVACTYASFLSLRGLWLGPLLIERHHFSLVETGNIALAVSVVGMVGPPLFGRIDPGPGRRRRWIVACNLSVAVLFALMAFNPGAAGDVAICLVMSVIGGGLILQYADVRSAYPSSMTGRAMAVFTMAMFLGVAIMQWLTGVVATVAQAHGVETYTAVLGAIALMLASATAAFRFLPSPTMPS